MPEADHHLAALARGNAPAPRLRAVWRRNAELRAEARRAGVSKARIDVAGGDGTTTIRKLRELHRLAKHDPAAAMQLERWMPHAIANIEAQNDELLIAIHETREERAAEVMEHRLFVEAMFSAGG